MQPLEVHPTLTNVLSNEKYMGTDFYQQILDDLMFYATQQLLNLAERIMGRELFLWMKAVNHFRFPVLQ